MASKYKDRNKVQIQVNSRGYIQYQIPGVYAQAIYGKKQKYIAFGAKNGVSAAAEAEEKVKLLQEDIEKGVFNPDDLSKYKFSKKQLKYSYRKHDSQITLLKLFDDYTDYRFPKTDEGTGRFKYQRTYRNAVKICPQQDVTKSTHQRQISEFIGQNRNYLTTVETLSILDRVIKRAILIGDLPENNPNVFRECIKEYKQINKSPNGRKYLKVLSEKGFVKDHSKKAWTKEEMEIIIDAFKNRKKIIPYYQNCDIYSLLLEFLFATGVRHGEAYGLFWNAVSNDFSTVLIHKSYSSKAKILKGTKTGKSRNIRLNKKAQEVLIKVKKFYQDYKLPISPNSPVFVKDNGTLFTNFDFHGLWCGRFTKSKETTGIVPQLVIDGKLNNYIDMYSTRRTFISLQAQNGIDAKTIADYVGDNVETILKHYYQGRENYTPLDIF